MEGKANQEISMKQAETEVDLLFVHPVKSWLTFTDYTALFVRTTELFILTAVRTSNPEC
jgi:hypothetical protein